MKNKTASAFHPRQGILLALLAFSLWSTGDAIVKYLGPTVPLSTIAFYDLIVIMAFLTGLGMTGKYGTLREAVFTPHWKWHILRGVTIYIQFLCGMYGFTHMSLARTYTLMFTMPLITAPMAALFMKERVAGRQWLAIALGFSGVLVVLRPGLIPLDRAAVAALCSAVFFSVTNLVARHVGNLGENKPLTFAWLPELACLVCSVPFFLLHPGLPDVHVLLWIVVMGIGSAAGFLCLSLAFARAPAATVAPFHYTQMLWAIALGYLFFHDAPDRWVLAGSALIIASGLWLIRQQGPLTADPLPDTITAPVAEE